MTVFFTSDLHIGLRLVSGYRGFGEEDVDYHDATLARRWDSVVGDDDHIWVLGDLSAGGLSSQRRALDWVSDRTGIKHLITGNHDGPHPMFRNAHRMMPEYLEVFESVAPSARRKFSIQGQPVEVLLSHFPYNGDGARMEDRYVQWRLRDLGVPIVHGHVHTPDILTRSLRGTPQIHIGVDARDMTPVPLDRLTLDLQMAMAS